jgi:hypothetical protein
MIMNPLIITTINTHHHRHHRHITTTAPAACNTQDCLGFWCVRRGRRHFFVWTPSSRRSSPRTSLSITIIMVMNALIITTITIITHHHRSSPSSSPPHHQQHVILKICLAFAVSGGEEAFLRMDAIIQALFTENITITINHQRPAYHY